MQRLQQGEEASSLGLNLNIGIRNEGFKVPNTFNIGDTVVVQYGNDDNEPSMPITDSAAGAQVGLIRPGNAFSALSLARAPSDSAFFVPSQIIASTATATATFVSSSSSTTTISVPSSAIS
ncbi:hypothetical protein A4X13_0g8526 [Tilletia indica]|uniref:Uncharacterized protein n=1 Tax=Tilletia indica TaxID=43049 RepID=A0A177TAH7_9BASI|nr:hypothetical protein A4X13_0g8526 [Tilletia indica]